MSSVNNAEASGTADNECRRRIATKLVRDAEAASREFAKEQIALGTWVVQRKPFTIGVTSEAWTKFGEVRHGETNEHMGYVCCLKCKLIKIFKPTSSSTTPLKKHKCPAAVTTTPDGTTNSIPSTSASESQELVSPSSPCKDRMAGAVVDWMVDKLLPANVFNGPQYINALQTAIDIGWQHGRVDANLLACDRTTLKRKLSSKADAGRGEVIPLIQEAAAQGFCAVTTDLWTEKFKSTHYMVITVHIVPQNFKLHSLILSLSKFPSHERETSENLAEQFRTQLSRFDIEPSRIVVVTDGGANIVKAVEQITGIKRIYCMDHCLNVILKSSFNMKLVDLNLYGSRGEEILGLVDLAVSFIMTSRRKPKCYTKLKKMPPPSTSRVYTPRTPCLEAVVENFTEVSSFLMSANQREIAEELNEADIRDLINFLKPIESKAKVHGYDAAEIDLDWLASHMQNKETDSAILQHLKEQAKLQFQALPIIKLMQDCKNIVTLFKRWNCNDLLQSTLKQEIATRWNSLLIMLLSFPKNFDAVNEILLQRKRDDLVLSPEKQTQILALIEFLEPWKEASDKVAAEKTPTLHLVLVLHCLLKKKCEEVATDSDGLRAIRRRASLLLQEKFIPDELHKIATFLWPDFKSLKMFSLPHERKKVYDAAENLASFLTPTRSDGATPSKRPKDDGFDLWRDPAGEDEDDEVEEYLAMKSASVAAEDVLEWWKQREERFPQLCRLARAVLCIPASSASSERAFSLTGRLLSPLRAANMGDDTADDTLFLNKFNSMKAQNE